MNTPMQIDRAPLQQRANIRIPQNIASLPWKAGQTLLAKVVNVLPDNKVTLELAGKLFEAQTTQQLTRGQQLKVVVEKQGENTLLRIVSGKAPEPPIRSFLRRTLPHQAPLKPMLETLAKLNLSETQLKQLPQPLRQDLQQIQQRITQFNRQLPTAEKLASAEGLKQAIINSGQFFESRIASTPSHFPANDIKGQLLQLFSLLARLTGQEAPRGILQPLTTNTGKSVAELIAQVRQKAGKGTQKLDRELLTSLLNLLKQSGGGLARVQSQQLVSVARQETNELVWLFDIPLRQEQERSLIRLRIQQEKKSGAEQADDRWRINLTIQDQFNQPVRIALQLSARRVSCTFHAHNADTAASFNEFLPRLNRRFQELGFEVEQLGCRHTTVTEEDDPLEHEMSGLLNVTA